MYIKEINIKTFGGLCNKTIKFTNGLNVIYGANESGKSTVIAFIKYIFYGISGRKNEFKRYVPLSGEPMCGSITVCDNDVEYEIFRTSKGAKSKQISVINKINGEEMDADFSQNIGKNLFLLGEDAFLNTLFVTNISNKISVSDGEIFSHLSNLAESGDENTSKEKIIEKIDADISNLSSPRRKNAIIPSLEMQISDINDMLYKAKESDKKIKFLKETLAKTNADLQQKAKEKEKYENEMKTAKAALDGEKIVGLENEILSLENEIKNLDDQFSSFDMSAYDGIKSISNEEEKRFLTDEGDSDKNAQNLILEERAKNITGQKKAAAVGTAFFIILLAVFAFTIPVLCVLSAAFAAASIYLYISANKKLHETYSEIDKIKKQKEENQAFISKFLKRAGLSSKEEYLSVKNAYAAFLSQSEVVKSKIEMKKSMLSAKKDEFKKLENYLLTAYNKNDKAKLFEDLKAAKPSISYDDAERKTAELSREISALQINLTKTEFEIQSLKSGADDVLSLEEHLENLKSDLDEKNEELKIITEAKRILEDASSEQQNNFAPELTKKVGEIFSRLTSGKHSEILIDKAFGAKFKNNGEYADETFLSKGALDQLYFSIRFGIIDMIKKKNVPVFLDDAFNQYDDFRLKTVFSYLCDYAKDTQVIISACREDEIKQIFDKINIINL
ncbi:MAG: AAA family ATPase [Oscillospiraceae bacterium]|nr:AAA family ATPase [Oscillospiraceae bacterium]